MWPLCVKWVKVAQLFLIWQTKKYKPHLFKKKKKTVNEKYFQHYLASCTAFTWIQDVVRGRRPLSSNATLLLHSTSKWSSYRAEHSIMSQEGGHRCNLHGNRHSGGPVSVELGLTWNMPNTVPYSTDTVNVTWTVDLQRVKWGGTGFPAHRNLVNEVKRC